MAVFYGVPRDDGVAEYLKCWITQSVGGNDVTVVGYMTEECQLSLSSRWNSPFEGDSVGSAGKVDKAASLIQSGTGNTSKTRLNSRQIWDGIDPPQVSLTLKFMAYTDPVNEVDLPIRYLMQMASPELNEKSPVGIGEKSLGRVPSAIKVNLGRRFVGDMRISEVSYNVNAPRTKNGNFAYNTVTITASPMEMINKSQIPNFFF